ncbi:MAG: DUF898 family protein [Minwuia sp.]|uniref:DUF898 family protein n=1 Tax=Minwuia sp. TaxID=2493630 RepID=UPI003A8402AA
MGLAYPWLLISTEGYAYNQSYVGDRQFRFRASARDLLKGWLPVWLIGLLAIVIPFAGLATFGILAALQGENPLKGMFQEGESNWIWMAAGITLPVAYILLFVAYAVFRARLFNVNVSGISLEDLRFHGAIRWQSFLSAYVRAVLLTAVIVGIPGVFLVVVLGPAGPFVLAFLAFIAFGFVRNIIIVHGLWKARVQATTVTGTIDVGSIRQAEIARMRQGEGFGMVFDAGFGEA